MQNKKEDSNTVKSAFEPYFIVISEFYRTAIKYYILSKTKRIFAIILGSFILIITFFLNLGYNPFFISPSSVCHVASWRNVIIQKEDSMGNKRLGIMLADGGIIVPCCISLDEKQDSCLRKGKYPFSSNGIPIKAKFSTSPFKSNDLFKDTITNSDQSLSWSDKDSTLTGIIPVASTFEVYLKQVLSSKLQNKKSREDSIKYYAAQLFVEIRKQNINYLITEKTYNIDSLKSLSTLEKLQMDALKTELSKFSPTAKDTTVRSKVRKEKRDFIKVMEDKHLVDFQRELTRSFLLCLIKDRAKQEDMSSMFTLARTYLLAFFTSVPAMNLNYQYKTNIGLNITNNDTLKNVLNGSYDYWLSSDDILKRKSFAWYQLFNCLCYMDMSANSKTFEDICDNNLSSIEKSKGFMSKLTSDLEHGFSDIASAAIKHAMKPAMKHAKDGSTLLEIIRKDLVSNAASLYQSKIEEFDSTIFVLKTLEMDESLKELNKKVLPVLLKILKTDPFGVYNNEFETIYRNLILVSTIRGNDISGYADSISKYMEEKDAFYIKINSLTKGWGDLEKSKDSIRTLLKKSKDILQTKYK